MKKKVFIVFVVINLSKLCVFLGYILKMLFDVNNQTIFFVYYNKKVKEIQYLLIQKLNVFIIWHGQSIFVKIRIKQLKKVFNRGNFVGSVGVHKNPFLILAWVRWKNNKHFRANTSVPMKHDEHQMLQYSILLRLNFWWAYIYFSARYLKKNV